jgi:hypothetical protein
MPKRAQCGPQTAKKAGEPGHKDHGHDIALTKLEGNAPLQVDLHGPTGQNLVQGHR